MMENNDDKWNFLKECFNEKNSSRLIDVLKKIERNEAFVNYLVKDMKQLYCPQCGIALLENMNKCYACNKVFRISKTVEYKLNWRDIDRYFVICMAFYLICFLSVFTVLSFITNIEINAIGINVAISIISSIIPEILFSFVFYRKIAEKREKSFKVSLKEYSRKIDAIEEQRLKLNKKINALKKEIELKDETD